MTSIRTALKIVATILIITGSVGAIVGFLSHYVERKQPSAFRRVCFPMASAEDVAVAPNGRIVVGLGVYRRIQVYDEDGRFLHGFYVETGGGMFQLKMQEDNLIVAAVRLDTVFGYTLSGKRIPLGTPEENRRQFETIIKQQRPPVVDRKGRRYTLCGPPMGRKVCRQRSGQDERVLIKTPIALIPYSGPINSLITLFFGVILLRFHCFMKARQMRDDNRSEDQLT